MVTIVTKLIRNEFVYSCVSPEFGTMILNRWHNSSHSNTNSLTHTQLLPQMQVMIGRETVVSHSLPLNATSCWMFIIKMAISRFPANGNCHLHFSYHHPFRGKLKCNACSVLNVSDKRMCPKTFPFPASGGRCIAFLVAFYDTTNPNLALFHFCTQNL